MVHAETIDTGATIAVLRAFGGPDVIKLEPFANSGSAVIGADNKWTKVKAVSLDLIASAAVGARAPRLRWLADEQVPFAEVVPPYTIGPGIASRITFAVDVQQAGANDATALVVPIPELTLLPGWELELDLLGFDVLDQVVDIRAYVERYTLVPVHHLIGG